MRRSRGTLIAPWCGLGLLLAIAVAAPARDVEITLNNGRTVSGEFVNETADAVTIRVADIETTYPRSQIKDMQLKLSLRKAYQQRRAELDDDDHAGHYKLARWLYNRDSAQGYRLALKELNRLLERKPDHTQAKLLRDVVKEKIEKQDQPPAPAPDSDSDGGSSGDSASSERTAPQQKMLTQEQIRLIKVFEVSLDSRPRVRIPPETIEQLFNKHGDDPVLKPYRGQQGLGRFRRLNGYEQLGLLFDLQARDLYDQVHIRDEPEVLNTFRTQIHTNYVVRYCGRCHGRGRAPGLYIATDGATSEQVAYTNYMLLRRTVAENKPLIYRPRPARSPLLQYGLPRRDAETPHPEVEGYRPYFRSAQDPRYQAMVQWIGRLWGETEKYPTEFSPPQGFSGEDDGNGGQNNPDQADQNNGQGGGSTNADADGG